MYTFEEYYKQYNVLTELGFCMPLKNKPLYIIGTGGSLRDTDVKNIVKNNDILSINRSWYYLKKIHGLTSNYNVTLDPNEFYELFKKVSLLKSDKDTFNEIINNTVFFMDKGTYTCDIRFGKPGKEKLKKLIHNLIKDFNKRGSTIVSFPSDKEYDSRFLSKKCNFLGGMENKLSMLALPMAFKLGYRNIFLLGTDYNYSTGHWYNPIGVDRIASFKNNSDVQKMNFCILKKWNDIFKKHNGKIISLVPDKYTKINKIL
jgi:hypothetical protein